MTTWVTAEDVEGLALDASHFILGNDVVQSDSSLGFERIQRLNNKHTGAVSLLAEFVCFSPQNTLDFFKLQQFNKELFLNINIIYCRIITALSFSFNRCLLSFKTS